MTLRDAATEETLEALRELLARGAFPGLSLKVSLEFLLSDGVMPESGLPVTSFLSLEDWVRGRIR
jgi:hypothetical protein